MQEHPDHGQATFAEQLRAQRAVAAAEAERFDLSDLRYGSGATSYLDLLDAQRSLFNAQQAAVQANLPRLQNQVTLYQGWAAAGAPRHADPHARLDPGPACASLLSYLDKVNPSFPKTTP